MSERTYTADNATPTLERIVESIQRYAATVFVTSTSALKQRKTRGGDYTENRPSSLQSIILSQQAKKGRNPVFFNDSEVAMIKEYWLNAIAGAAKTGDIGQLRESVETIARFMREAFVRHIYIGRTAGMGPMRPLMPVYERIKIWRYGQQPILKATGQLIESIQSRVEDF